MSGQPVKYMPRMCWSGWEFPQVANACVATEMTATAALHRPRILPVFFMGILRFRCFPEYGSKYPDRPHRESPDKKKATRLDEPGGWVRQLLSRAERLAGDRAAVRPAG